MQVFKAFIKVVLSRVFIPILYTVIFLGISFAIAFSQTDNEAKFSGEKLSILVQDEDNTAASKAFIDYISRNNNVTVDSEHDSYKNDLNMFYQKTDYSIIIKSGYEENIKSGKTDDLFDVIAIDGSYASAFAMSHTENYVMLLAANLKRSLSLDDALKATNELMNTETKITMQSAQEESRGVTGTGKAFFRYLPYIFIGMIVSTLVPALMIMNEKNIKARTVVSCISETSRFSQTLLATIVYAFAIWVVFMAAAAVMFGGELFTAPGLMLLGNTLVLMLTAVSIAILLSNLMKSPKPADMAATTIGLGMSFLCGVFVPLEYLSSGVKAVAHVLPAYWYVSGIEAATGKNGIDTGEYILCLGIQLGITGVILAASALFARRKA